MTKRTKFYVGFSPTKMKNMRKKVPPGFSGIRYTREIVRIRDNHTCQDCRSKWDGVGRRFDVHHLDECGQKSLKYDSIYDISRLITLCHKCHYNRSEHRVKRKVMNR